MKWKVFFIAFVVAFLCSSLFFLGFLSSVDLRLKDNLYGGKTALSNIVIVAVDEQSIEELGRWPWDRDLYGKVIDYLNDSSVIGFDIGFFDSTKEDYRLKYSIEKNPNVVLPVQFTSFKEIDNKIVGDEVLVPVFNADYGYINVITDFDGVSRAINPSISDVYKPFSVVVAEKYLNTELDFDDNRFLINFVGPPLSFQYFSFSDVLNKRVEKDLFKDKIVLIGSSAHELHDNYFVPTGLEMPGVELHAHAVQSFLTRDFLVEQPDFSVVLMILLTSLFIAFLVYWRGLVLAPVLTVLFIIAFLFLAIFLFDKGFVLNIVFVPFTSLISFLSIVSFKYLFEKKSKLEIVGAFNKYVSPAVLQEILKNPAKLKLGGSRKEITVFFSDIRGFTSFSEKLKPEKLVIVLNEYLSSMTKIVMDHDGVVDKYIGDAIMAFWGAPLKQPDHALLACSTCLDMKLALKELQKDWKKRNFPKLKIGMGLNSGFAVIGNMGSFDRFDYTAIGDSINLGSRLEGLTKQYGVDIIISNSTKNKVSKQFSTRLLDLVTVKGKKKPIKIHELVCRKKDQTLKQKQFIQLYESGFKLYLKKKWKLAIVDFKKALKLRNDLASKNMIDRCRSFKKNPPKRDWDGVFQHTKK